MPAPALLVLALLLASCGAAATIQPSPAAKPTVIAPPTAEPTESPTPRPTPEASYSLLVMLDVHDPVAKVDLGIICETSFGYDDIHEGTQVTVRDENENIIGVGDLGAGLWRKRGKICGFVTRIEDVPDARSTPSKFETAGCSDTRRPRCRTWTGRSA